MKNFASDMDVLVKCVILITGISAIIALLLASWYSLFGLQAIDHLGNMISPFADRHHTAIVAVGFVLAFIYLAQIDKE